jgi:2-aminoethylphosphonate-pyruvate transaminase
MTSGTVPRARAEVLLCPGPVMLSPGVKAALARCEIGHRDARFSELVARLRRNCGLVLGANEGHSVVFITGPATAAIEAACVSLLPPDASVIVPMNGTFGARIAEILKVDDVPCTPIDFGFGKPFDLARIEAALADPRHAGFPAALAMTHHETSAGLINPVAEVCALARRNGLRTLVDATSSAGAEDLDVTRDGIDVCITSSGKCLHAPPGIAVACVRRDMLAARVGAAPRSYSLDLLRHHDQLEANSQTPFTPAVPLFVALDRAVEELLEEGVAERHRSYLRRRAFLAAGLRRLGLPLLRLPAGTEACSILTVGVPPPLDLDALYWSMCEQGYVIYRAKAPLAPDYFQLGVMGELSEADLSGFLEGLESLLFRPAGRCRAVTA